MGEMFIGKILNKARKLFLYCLNKRRYKSWYLDSVIIKPMVVRGKDRISVGRSVSILNNARIEAISQYGSQSFAPDLIIHDGVTIQQNAHITCAERVEIGKNTAIVANVTITDIIHPYTSEDIHVIDLPIITKPVRIGAYCGIYNNVVINAGVTIGDHVTIGANSVVSHDIPEYSVAVGSPARVVKRYNFNTQEWERV